MKLLVIIGCLCVFASALPGQEQPQQEQPKQEQQQQSRRALKNLILKLTDARQNNNQPNVASNAGPLTAQRYNDRDDQAYYNREDDQKYYYRSDDRRYYDGSDDRRYYDRSDDRRYYDRSDDRRYYYDRSDDRRYYRGDDQKIRDIGYYSDQHKAQRYYDRAGNQNKPNVQYYAGKHKVQRYYDSDNANIKRDYDDGQQNRISKLGGQLNSLYQKYQGRGILNVAYIPSRSQKQGPYSYDLGSLNFKYYAPNVYKAPSSGPGFPLPLIQPYSPGQYLSSDNKAQGQNAVNAINNNLHAYLRDRDRDDDDDDDDDDDRR